MQVFTDEWSQKLRLRYENSGVSAPPLYRLATEPKYQSVRDTIQQWIDRLSENSQKKVVEKIRNPKSFHHTYNELKIASILFKKYLIIEYEEEILGLTPDWIVKNQSNEILLIVEVLTRENSVKDKSLSKRINELWGRITSIKIGIGLDLSYGDEFDEKLLDSKLIKQIFRDVKNWLEKKPIVGTRKDFGNFEFRVIHYNDKWKDVQILGPGNSLWVDNLSLKENIEGKIKKYRNLIEYTKVPFIVGVVPDFTTAVSKNTLEDILFGQEVFVIREDSSTFLDRKPDGIFNQRKNISGVIGYFNNEVEIFHNPNADIPSKTLI